MEGCVREKMYILLGIWLKKSHVVNMIEETSGCGEALHNFFFFGGGGEYHMKNHKDTQKC